MLKRSMGLVVLFAGCGGQQPPPTAITPAPATVKAPFEYKILETDEKPHFMGPQVALTIETSNDVAKAASEDDLRQFWEYIAPTLGNRRVFIWLSTPVPGVMPWGGITRVNDFDGNWKLDIDLNEFGVDADPYYFVDKIDRTKPNQGAMILTLPVVNKIIERLKRDGWTIKERQEDFVSAEKNDARFGSLTVTLTPEGINFDAHRREDTEVFDVISLLTEELAIGDDIKRKMQSVIGSPEYFRGNSNGVGVWHWTIGKYDVSYYHTEPGVEDISIGYAN